MGIVKNKVYSCVVFFCGEPNQKNTECPRRKDLSKKVEVKPKKVEKKLLLSSDSGVNYQVKDLEGKKSKSLHINSTNSFVERVECVNCGSFDERFWKF